MIRTALEDECWTPEPWFLGQTVFILGGGPGLTPELATRLAGRRCIKVNSSCPSVPPDAVLFFTDNSWFETHEALVRGWKGPAITQSRLSKRALPSLLRVRSQMARDFPPKGSDWILQGKSTGQTAIGLAAALGAARIVLLGFDMRWVDGREHHHDDYLALPPERRPVKAYVYDRTFLPAFRGWGAAAKRAGLTVLNATPESALKEFPIVEPEAVLC